MSDQRKGGALATRQPPHIAQAEALDPDVTQKVQLDPALIEATTFTDGDVTQKVRLDPALLEASIPEDDEFDGLDDDPDRPSGFRVRRGAAEVQGWLTDITPQKGVPAVAALPTPAPIQPPRTPTAQPLMNRSTPAPVQPPRTPAPQPLVDWPVAPLQIKPKGLRISTSGLIIISVMMTLVGVIAGAVTAFVLLTASN